MWNRIKLLKHKFRYDDTELPFLEHLDALASFFIISLIVGIMIIPFADDLIYFLRIPADFIYSVQVQIIRLILFFQNHHFQKQLHCRRYTD